MNTIKRYRFIADDGTGTYRKTRVGCRGILLNDGKILLGHEWVTDYYCIPGGGQEVGESLEMACKREMAEEMGLIVQVDRELAVVESLWEDLIYENHFFLCTYRGKTKQQQTDYEQQVNLQPEWMSLEEARVRFADPEIAKRGLDWLGCYKRDLVIIEALIDET